MSASDISINRDLENDVLYVIRKDADRETTINICADADVLIRLDRTTRELVGLTIEDFSQVFPKVRDWDEWALMEYFDDFIELWNTSQAAISRVP